MHAYVRTCVVCLDRAVHDTQRVNPEAAERREVQAGSGQPEPGKQMFTLLDLCVSSLRRGHANLLCIDRT
eukprot:5709321-Heterocapsa_arctica.AAC.1